MPAKVNVHLGIYPGRDANGYHRADSVMVAVGIYDEVSVRAADAIRVSFAPEVSVAPERTAVWRVVNTLNEAGLIPRVSVAVRRAIPSEGGLGSASADAAATLLACRALRGIDDDLVIRLARKTGADVAFFLDPAPSFLAGRGDELVEAYPSLDLAVALVKPPVGVSTAAAYAEFDRLPTPPRPTDAIRQALATGNACAVASNLHNNLADASVRLAPEIGQTLTWIRSRKGVRGAQVTGSGSCVFALCETDGNAHKIAEDAARLGWWSVATRTVGADAASLFVI